MSRRDLDRRAGALAGLTLGALCLAAVAVRRATLNWGATSNEITGVMPGDDLLPSADLVATRAITIASPPHAVWPWLIQIGTGRAGAYSYDWLDRLAGLDMDSVSRIVPEFQNLAVGDMIPVANDGTGLRVWILEPNQILGTRTEDNTWAWTWVLSQVSDGTRLLSRTRMDTRQSPILSRLATHLLLVPASWVMERKMLLGLRQRAERPNPEPETLPSTEG